MQTAMRTVLGEGFRVFFLAAGIYAVLAMGIWLGILGAEARGAAPALPFAPAPYLWHAHEMIFGYAAAVLGGFFLTAVPSWTGTAAARRGYLAAAAAAWLAGRLAVWWSGALPPGLVAVADLAFLPLLGVKIALQLARRPKPQNMMLLGVLAIIWSGNLMVHLEWTGLAADTAGTGLRVGLLGVTATIAVIGGRVAPAFTRNAMTRAGVEARLPQTPAALDAIGVGTAILLPLMVLLGAPEMLLAAVALACGAAQAARLMGWRTGWVLGQPILWSLHLGFAMLAAGYAILGLGWAGLTGEIAGLHVLGIGAVGGMTLAVMSRATLGHTGRPLVAPRATAVAYALIAAAALVRAAGSTLATDWYTLSVLGSGALWIAGFAIFLSDFWGPLTTPRA
ncbi:NnrS family protein [Limibaculum sp. FT325]|nr:NnrS family protein [Limibaculum sediminis]